MPQTRAGLAAGNAVVLKPASDTPLVAMKLVEILLEAGLPPLAISCLTGGGGELGEALCTDRRVRKISFTGSRDVGERIIKMAGLKRVTMELGSNSPLIVMDDADLEKAAEAIVATGYANAGQVCISTQRVLTDQKVYGDLVDALKPQVAALKIGNPLEESTKMGPMIREADAARVGKWIDEAVASRRQSRHRRPPQWHAPRSHARGRRRTRTCASAATNCSAPPSAVTPCRDIDEAIRLANDTNYGLSAADFHARFEPGAEILPRSR